LIHHFVCHVDWYRRDRMVIGFTSTYAICASNPAIARYTRYNIM